ncbi:DNA mismatch repair endonuclease MutL [Thiohalophilus sp.]|uniref:DNA mismatch repair endonuclease MutL n=1 Tax=Thiohalophilus sp. TaxID=3028392 RepID=UPI0039752AC2
MQPARRYQPDAIIQRLPPILANQIAAGEVVERPASIVKELVENALDAGARRIDVQIRNGGLEQIQVSDDGYGIRPAELELAVSPHATSKIAQLADLENLASLGFRGEALASIGSVARLVIDSRFTDTAEAWRLSLTDREAGPQLVPVAHPVGTTVSVSELFYNTPARRRFLRTERTEYRYIEDMLKRLALSRFEVGFSLRHNAREVFRLPPATTAAQQARRVERLCGKAFYAQALHIDYSLEGLRLWGWLARPEAARSQADLQYVYVNGRSVRDKLINHALRQAQGQLYPGRHPAWLLYMELDPLKVDVNVHPTKHEVRFHQARQVHDFLVHAVSEALAEDSAAARPATRGWNPSAAEPRGPFYSPAEGNIPAAWSVREAARVEAPAAVNSDDTRSDKQILATLAGGYLVVEEQGALLLINAPAVRAAQLAASFASGEAQTARPLLIPETIELSAAALQWLEEQAVWLARHGIDVSAISETSVLLRQVPAAAASHEPAQWLTVFVELILAGTAPEVALAQVLSCPPNWSAVEQQALVRDALSWQRDPQPARYWLRWDQAALQTLFET